jgi:hypothetical protein
LAHFELTAGWRSVVGFYARHAGDGEKIMLHVGNWWWSLKQVERDVQNSIISRCIEPARGKWSSPISVSVRGSQRVSVGGMCGQSCGLRREVIRRACEQVESRNTNRLAFQNTG